jgi:hypothetical protein
MIRKFVTTALLITVIVMTPTAANAARPVDHHCTAMSIPIIPPVAGYLIGLHSKPHKKLFYRSVDDLTAGLFYGMGGDWVMKAWCTS